MIGDWLCVAGACIPGNGPGEGCLGVAACYPAGAYCGAVDGSTACVDGSCGSGWNECDRCALGPNGGAAEVGGPLLFAPAQVRACSMDAGVCPDVAPWACSFAFAAWSPDGSLPLADLETMVLFLDPTCAVFATFDTTSVLRDGYPMYAFQACFPADEAGRVEGAVFLVDIYGRASQTLCVAGETTGSGGR